MDVFSSFAPNKAIIIDKRDPPWMTDTDKIQNSVAK